MSKKYTIGIDFGTLSGRAVVVDTASGDVLGEAVYEYPHAVIENELPCGKKLPEMFALQHPEDYLKTLGYVIPEAMAKAGACKEDVKAVCVDFTCCTLIPIYEDGTPLCFDEKYKSEPHAYVKLWKHHASQPEADRIIEVAKKRGEEWLNIYGGKISSEWAFPKMLEVLHHAPEVYRDTYRFMEAADWISLVLTGKETHSTPFAGYKAMWNTESGFPSKEYFAEVDPDFADVVGTKWCDKVDRMDGIAGLVNEKGAELTGLAVGTVVSMPMPDAHIAMYALNIVEDKELLFVIGTSSCHIINSKKKLDVPGICGYVKDGLVPGYYTYEAGQACVGDGFDRFVKNYVPESYTVEARERGISIHKFLREKAQGLKVGESGLIALTWFNGNRNILVDADLSGMIVGLKINTRPEEIYRAIIEGTAFGTRVIIDNYTEHGIEIGGICACGGISLKDEMLMQIYADVTNRPIRVTSTLQTASLGCAVYAAYAAGIYSSIPEAAKNMSKPAARVYYPDPENVKLYDRLYAEYKKLHDYFGRGENDVMKKLTHFAEGEQ